MTRNKKHSNRKVSEKIRVLRHENVPEKQAVAMALNMNREGRLGEHGEYHRVGKRGKRRRGSRT